MAWFNKDKNDVEAPTPVTLDRIEDSLKRHDCAYDRRDEAILTAFEGFATVFEVGPDGAMFSVYLWSTGAFMSKDHFDETLAWSCDQNRDGVFGTARPYIDDDDDVMMRIDTSYFTQSGATDEQIDEMVGVAITCSVEILNKYISDMGIERKDSEE